MANTQAGLASQEAVNQQIMEQYMKNMQDMINAQRNMQQAANGASQLPTQQLPTQQLPTQQLSVQQTPVQQSPVQQMPAQTRNQPAPTMSMQSNQMPETLTNPAFTAGYLRTQIGKLMRVEFLIGNSITDRVGRLAEVGASFIILQALETNTRYMCDLFSIKFVNIVDGPTPFPELAVL